IKRQIFEKHGKPECILTDCGKEFTAKEVADFLNRENVNTLLDLLIIIKQQAQLNG
ncbi:hypothetical protein M153_230390003, partial [Pseudoloma neurophilia]